MEFGHFFMERDWFKYKGYLHLTPKIPRSEKQRLSRLFNNPKWIAQHAFYPLLLRINTQRRFRRRDDFLMGHKKKIREIHYPTHIDAHIFAFYASKLRKHYESMLQQTPELSDTISAYRRIPTIEHQGNKSNIHFAHEAFSYIKSKGDCVAIAMDISGFFPNLDHKILKRRWCELLGTKSLPADHYNVYKAVTKFSYINLENLRGWQGFDEQRLAELRKMGILAFFQSGKELRKKIKQGEVRVFPNNYRPKIDKDKKRQGSCGIPHGLPISAVLANLYMYPFDQEMYEEVIVKRKRFYRRYSDDILIVVDQNQMEEVQNIAQKSIEKYRLIISAEKTECIEFKNCNGKLRSFIPNSNKEMPIKYLGFEFHGHKTLIKPGGISAFYRKMKDAVKRKEKLTLELSDKHLINDPPLFKRKLRRLFTSAGIKKRKLVIKRPNLKQDSVTKEFYWAQEEHERKYRGNYLSYAYRAGEIMQEPAIKRQLRNADKLFKKELAKKNLIRNINS